MAKHPFVTLGIDEAGRGSVIGPLVVAGVSLTKKNEEKLKKAGVKDSKLLSHKRREALGKKIEAVAKDIVIVSLSACRIDDMRRKGINLNRIEAMKFIDIANFIPSEKIIVDSPDVNAKRMALILKKGLENKKREVVAEHKADYNHTVVAAASIIAKNERERIIAELRKEYGDFGPGYSSNAKTMKWMENWRKEKGQWPDIVRKTWMTAKNAEAKHKQNVLGKFFRKREKCGKKI